MEELKKDFGKRLKELRKSQGLTQEQLAEKIGMDTQNLCKMENGSHFPQTKNLYKIAKVLDIEVKDLFDYGHFMQREKLVSEITDYLNKAATKELEFIYKIIKSFKEYVK